MGLFTYTVLDDKGKSIGTVDNKKAAVLMARTVLGKVKRGNKVIYSARNPLKLRGAYPHQPAAEAALKKMGAKGYGSHVGYDVVKKKWVIVTPTPGNGAKKNCGKRNGSGIEYGVAVIGAPASLSKAGFKTMADARKWLAHLRSRGVLAGRAHEILKIDNDAMKSTVVESKQNSAASSKRRAGKTSNKVRKHKKFMKKLGLSGSDIQYVRGKKRGAANPAGKLSEKLSHMKPGRWYPTTLSGKRAKIQRKGSTLTVRTV